MARKNTPHMLVDEGRTGRIIARRALRRSLGNPNKRSRDLAELMQEMFFKGISNGRKLENLRIAYSTAGMEYGEGYPVDSSVPEPVVGPVPESDPRTDYADGDAIPA